LTINDSIRRNPIDTFRKFSQKVRFNILANYWQSFYSYYQKDKNEKCRKQLPKQGKLKEVWQQKKIKYHLTGVLKGEKHDR